MLNRPINVIFFGDSVCVGQGVSPHLTWVNFLSAHLTNYVNAIAPNSLIDFLVTNASVNGRTSRQALEAMAFQVQAHSPDILYIQFGLNDCNTWSSDLGVPRVSSESFRENLREIVRRGRTFGATEVILATNHNTQRRAPVAPEAEMSFDEANALYNGVVRELAEEIRLRSESKVTLVDHEVFDSDTHEHLLYDGIHLSLTGHVSYFKRLAPVLEASLSELCAARRAE